MIDDSVRRDEGAAARALPAPARARRVLVLLIGIVVLSAADLAITLTHLQGAGMMEANPIAAWLIRTTESAWSLGLFKALTVTIAVSVIYRLRRHIQGELAAWCGLVILAGVAWMWQAYTEQLHPDDAQPMLLSFAEVYSDQWLVID